LDDKDSKKDETDNDERDNKIEDEKDNEKDAKDESDNERDNDLVGTTRRQRPPAKTPFQLGPVDLSVCKAERRFSSPARGVGLFATCNIKMGEVIHYYTGTVRWRKMDGNSGETDLHIPGEDLIIVGSTADGGLGCLANDFVGTRKKQNAKTKWFKEDKVMKLIATKDVDKDCEIFISYGKGFREKNIYPYRKKRKNARK